jgi:hypothetical protein
MRQTNPIGPGRGCRVRSPKCQVGKVPPCRPLTSSSKLQTSHAPRGNRAKRSQTWEGWGISAKPVAMLGVSQPGSETCKTQFRPVGRRRRRVNAQNEPNLARCGRVAAGIVRNEPNFAPGIDRPARPVPVGLNIPPFQDSISRSGYVKCAARCLDHARHDKREGVCLRRGCRASGFAEGGVCGTKDWA